MLPPQKDEIAPVQPQEGATEKGAYLAKATGRGPAVEYAPPPENLGKAPKYNWDNVNKHIQELRAGYQTAASVLPSQVTRDETGKVASGWSPTQALNPQGDPLPWGAYGWDDRGYALYGDKNDKSLVGDIKSFGVKLLSGLTGGQGPTAGPATPNVEALSAASATLKAPIDTSSLGAAAGSILAKGAAVAGGLKGLGGIVGRITTGVPATIGSVLEAVNVGATALERGAGGQLLTLKELGDQARYLPAVPEGIREFSVKHLAGGFALAPMTSYLLLRAGESFLEGKWKPADVPAALDRNFQASRIFYSLWIHDNRQEEFIRDLKDGGDPRALAIEYEDPSAEMVGQMLHDPTVLIGMVAGSLKAARAMEGARLTVANEDIVKLLKAAPGEIGSEQWVNSLDDAVGQLYREAERGISRQATNRGFTELTAEGKRFVSTREGQKVFGVLAKHFENNQSGMLEAVEAMARMASASPQERLLGIETMARLTKQYGLPAELMWSEEGARTGVVVRNLVTDAEGKINPSATILRDIEDAGGDAAKLTESATKRLDSAYEKMFPTVEQQIKQNAEYARLLSEDPTKAAKYLAQNPAAATEVGEFTKNLSRFYNALPRPVMNVMHTVQAAMYMILSPGYAVRNHLQNVSHILVDRGPRDAYRALTFGGKAAEENLGRMLGYDASALLGGFGKAGAEAPSIARLGGLAMSARAEQSAAAVVVNGAVEEALDQAAKYIPMDELAALSADDQRLLRYYLKSEMDPDKAIERFYAARGTTQKLLTDLTDEEYRILRQHRNLRDVEQALQQGASQGDIDRAFASIKNNYDDLARREASGVTIPAMADAPEWEQRAMSEILTNVPTEASEEAGLLAKNINANRAATRDMEAYLSEQMTNGQSKRLTTLLGEVQPGQGASVALSAGGPDAAAARNIADVQNQVNREFNQLKQNYGSRLNALTDTTYKASDDFRKTAWGWSDLSKDYARAGDKEGLARLWREANIPGEVPDVGIKDAAKRFRDLLWSGEGATPGIYRQRQNSIWSGHRDNIIGVYQQQLDELAKLTGLTSEDMATNYAEKAQASLTRARILDTADFSGIPGLQPTVLGKDRADLGAFARGEELLGENSRNARKIIRDNATPEERAALAEASAKPPPKPLYSRIEDASVRLSPGERDLLKGGQFQEASIALRDGASAEDAAAKISDPFTRDKWLELYRREAGLPAEARADDIVRFAQEPEGIDIAARLRGQEGPPQGIPGEEWRRAKAQYDKLAELDQSLVTPVRTNPPATPVEAVEREIANRILEDEQAKASQLDLLIAPHGDEALTASRAAAETRDGYFQFLDGIKEKVNLAFEGRPIGQLSREHQAAVEAWRLTARGEWTKARAGAVQYATGVRDFTLLSYPKRYGGDLVAGTIFPYHFWYSRTYKNWMSRVAQNPYLLSSYARYRQYLEKVHAGLPDWWKYQMNSNELLGLNSENPLWFNLEATLNPMNGITGTDFNDPYRRIDGTAKILDDLGKFGPGIWTGYSLALATSYLIQGKDDAAGRWAGRLTTATKTIRDATALLGLNRGKGYEIDPLVQIFSGGLTPYDRNKVAQEFDTLTAAGVPQVDVEQAAYDQSGPVWDTAVAQATQQRAPGNIASWLFGVGFKPRTDTDIQLDQMWADRSMVLSQMPNMPPDKRRQAWDELRTRYPFMDAVMLARKGGVERDQAYTYLVLGRIPPGMQDDFAKAVGIDYQLVNDFYDDASALDNMPLTDRNRFMAGIADIGAMLDVPSEATKAEWTEARNRYGDIRSSVENAWGEDIYDKIDVFYGKAGDDQKSRDAQNLYLQQHPEVSAALDYQTAAAMGDPLVGAYYSSIKKIESYWNGRMYNQIETELGPEIWDTWDAYYEAKLTGDQKDYWKAHPELQRYLDIRDAWDPVIAKNTADFALRLPDRESFRLRPSAQPESLGQQAIAGMEQQNPAFRFSRQEWEGYFGGPLTNLVTDYVVRGTALPAAATDKLSTIAASLNLPDDPLLLVELYQRSVPQSGQLPNIR